MNGVGVQARMKNELYTNLQVWDRLPDDSLKIAADKIVQEERVKAKGQQFEKHPSL